MDLLSLPLRLYQQSSPDPERIDHFTDGWRNYTSSEEAEILIENMELLKES